MDFSRVTYPTSLADVIDQYISVSKKSQLFQAAISWKLRNSHVWKGLMMIDSTNDNDEEDDVPLHKNSKFPQFYS